MKRCDYCGNSSEDNTRFCSHCGSKFPEQVEQPAAQPAQQYAAPADDVYQTTYQPTYQTAAPTYDQSVYNPVMMGNDYPTTSGLAVAGFVVSLISIFCCGFTAIIGLILSIAGLISASKKNKKGMGFAIAGLVISGLLTLFIAVEAAVCWPAIQAASEKTKNGDFAEFMENFTEELDNLEEHYENNGRIEIDNEWTDFEVDDDMSCITIEYEDGIPDDFEFFNSNFDEICDALEDELYTTDNFGQTVRFDRETFRKLVTFQFISAAEYENMGLTRNQLSNTLAYLAVLSFEMHNDNFEPETAIYYERSNSYEYYGPLDDNNIGHAVIVFTDGTNNYEFDDAMCGDEICWAYDFGEPEVFRLGLDSDSLDEYPATGFIDVAEYAYSIIDPLIR